MQSILSAAGAARRARSSSRRSTPYSSVYESPISEESFSSFSDDSESEKRRRGRRKAVTRRVGAKRKVVADSDPLAKVKPEKPVKAVAKAKAKAKPRAVAKKASPASSPDELVKFAKKEGTTRFHQMRAFLEKANETDKPVDLLSGFLASRRSPSPTRSRRSSVASGGSPRLKDFRTGLTPSSVDRRVASPQLARRDSDDFAWDLDTADASAAHKVGSFIHGQRSLNLRSKLKTVGAGDNLSLALLMEDIPNMTEKMHAVSRAQIRERVLANTADGEEDKENASSLDESQLAEIDLMLGL